MSPTSYQTALPRSKAVEMYIPCGYGCQTKAAASGLRRCCTLKLLKKLTFFVTEVPLYGCGETPMEQLVMRSQFFGLVVAAAFGAALAAPAVADPVYSWRTEDGGYAFTDDPKGIPARYRDQAQVRIRIPVDRVDGTAAARRRAGR